MYIYLATGFIEKEITLIMYEFLSIFKASMGECIDMIENGKITDAKTIIVIICARDYLGKNPYFFRINKWIHFENLTQIIDI